MERRMDGGQEYDFRQHDRIWQRVSPELTPFPELRGNGGGGMQSIVPRTQAAELQLPGAEANPCCLGSAAQESLPVLEGFLREERQACRLEKALLHCAPAQSAFGVMEKLVRSSGGILRRLSAILFLIEGRWPEREETGCFSGRLRWQEGLRMAYHLEACGAMNYIRAAEGTTDPCLNRLLMALSQEKYARADQILNLLSASRRQ